MTNIEIVNRAESIVNNQERINHPSADDISMLSAALGIARVVLRKQEERKWVPVSERLPDADGIYLCVWQGKKVDTGFFLNRHFRIYGEIKDRLVTHWMPLPGLPKEE